MQTEQRPVIAILGGSGAEGSGLAFRWAHAGYPVIIGSRSAEKAAAAAQQINTALGREAARGCDNPAAAAAASIVVLTVPYAAQRATVEEVREALTGKILVDVTVPLKPPKVNRVQLPDGGSAVEAIQRLLGDQVKVVSAFQNISAHHLKDLDHVIECDVLVCSDDRAAADTVIGLARDIGLGAWNAGVLANSAAAEALTSVLIALNQRYKVPAAGIRITGIPR
ncbi:MAG TPA: NADPH-dependent F420 reductase [Steroidobacter sp.]|jgi:NADPH-dependent F420 reductase|nr:NADPH-dependent F420 reductase [Steroidobacteraceae bacterium]HLS80506.1 NADPH-dependent F420 reductase [Steroidobacter sp.]